MHAIEPAAFGRLCVETDDIVEKLLNPKPAAFGRLCVETYCLKKPSDNTNQPPSGGCVLKPC